MTQYILFSIAKPIKTGTYKCTPYKVLYTYTYICV